MKKWMGIIIGAVLIVAAATIIAVICSGGDGDPAFRKQLDDVKQDVLQFDRTYGRPPVTLYELYRKDLTDPWGKSLIYAVANRKVTLGSYGKDGLAGGSGLDQDLVLVFANIE
jgi:hypothetical protein